MERTGMGNRKITRFSFGTEKEKKFEVLEFSIEDFVKHIESVNKKIKKLKLMNLLSKDERMCLAIYFEDVSSLLDDQHECKQWRKKSKQAVIELIAKGDDELRMKKALGCFNLSIKGAKKNINHELLAVWEVFEKQPGAKLQSGKWQIYAPYFMWTNGDVKIEWEDHPKEKTRNRNRKIAIISFITSLFRLKSNDATIKRLNVLGTKGLPGKNNSGTRWEMQNKNRDLLKK